MSLKTVVAAAFRHLRKERLQKVEFIYYISIDRKWMNKDQAALLLERARDEGLITLVEGAWVPAFDPAEVEIPLGFKPSAGVLEKHDPVERLVAEIAQKAGADTKSIYAEMNRIISDSFHGNLMPEAAVVILARRYKVPSGKYRAELISQLIENSPEKTG
ncbi:DUF2240 family protein [Methanocalculus sp.]|uniref:DUF2240 family protein n=1 Tax=Methanocalculus sp. TaxID=2004547 RepID=UPI0026329BFE|nr:DUF2240 family protein [Methanocalculus sp.]MDG6249579.1 DUF2240 family protein [Methanocalculus sp.]